MGTYLNPGNSGFAEILKTEYVDKTGLISLINATIGTKRKLTCISRPRRFGKSYAAQMLCAYYGKTCDSHSLFSGYKISAAPDYEEHLGKYDVIYLDMAAIKPYTRDYTELVEFLIGVLTDEICESYPGVIAKKDFTSMLVDAVCKTGNKFFVIIDEWDAPIRENPSVQNEYLEFLRSLFKNSGVTSKVFAAAYMTGILPIKKDGNQSAVSDFQEYTVIKPRQYGEYVGFTEDEVRRLCQEHDTDFNLMKEWYDGYDFMDVGSIYNPNSVMQAIENNDMDSYWTESAAAEGLMEYISKPYNGLTKTIAELIGGVEVGINTNGFANDLITFKSKDDVLTLLIHLGYLAYDSKKKTVHIPNEEVKLEFQKTIREVDHEATLIRLRESEQLFIDTINGNEEAVARQIEKIHAEETVPLHYNREDSLRSVIKLAYYTYRDHYMQWEELPAGTGYADIVYLPKHESDWPALVIELKWNKSVEGAIDQILRKEYPKALEGYGSSILLVGISYDKDASDGLRKHSCRIQSV
ncbi:MAG TPA: AAA family ATPase [Lachnospiraceae bacterium]|nr:AAA family ATPase [Lachnospiraceae bacterium]